MSPGHRGALPLGGLLVLLAGIVFSGALQGQAQPKAKRPPERRDPHTFICTPPACFYGVSVTPDNATAQPRVANTNGYTEVFTVTNTGNQIDGYQLTCSVTGNLTCAGISPSGAGGVPGQSTAVTVTYNTGLAGTGVLTLKAKSNGDATKSNTGTYNVSIAVYGAVVTPDGTVATTRPPNSSGYSESFSIRNSGTGSNTYALSCAGATNVTCTGTNPTSLTLAAGVTGSATASYYTGSIATGTIVLRAVGTFASDTGYFSVPVVAAGVAVTPDSGSTTPRLASSGPYTDVFTVKNTGGGSTAFTLSCGGSSNVTCSGINPTSVTLGAGAQSTVTATYSVGVIGTGTLSLTASSVSASDLGSFRVGVVSAAQQAPAVDVASVNPGTLVERDLCTTIALGGSSAAECGDLRIVHALPSTRSMNKARTPILEYSSQQARPRPIVAALVTLPSNLIPDSIEAVLKVNGVTRHTARWGGSQWAAGATRRIAASFDGLNDATGIYPYTLEVATIYGAARLGTTVSGQLVIVNRQASPFGVGWWLAGLEQLNLSTMVWVGGDGSVRQYQQVVGTTDKWVAPSVDHPDTLKQVMSGGTYYVRYLSGGAEVWFNTLGQHVYTYNRQKHRTTFAYAPTTGVLSSITLPAPFSVRAYQFTYTSSAPYRLTTVAGPDISTPSGLLTRNVVITQTGGFITAIQDPDGNSVQFVPVVGVPELVRSRTDRRGTLVTFAYDALGGKKIAASTVTMGSGQPNITLLLAPQQSLGLLGQSVDPVNAYTLIDGPRTDSADVTKIWQDRFGQPVLSQNAHNSSTLYRRGDVRWPGLVTEVVQANGWRVTASYDARGNLAASTDYGFGGAPTTSYTWDQKWDQLTKIKRPEGDSVVISYDPSTGNRLWQQDGRGTTTRVNFTYNAANQLLTIVQPSTPAESLFYDLGLGNISVVKTAKRFDTRYTQDGVGRVTMIEQRLDTLVNLPPSAGWSEYQTSLTYYDLMDRDTVTVAIGPMPLDLSADPETLFVRKFYSTTGQADSLWRWAGPDPNNIDTIRTRWRYDALGRPVVEIDPKGMKDSTVFDPAGNPVTVLTRRGHTISMVYDAMNRRVRRVLPSVSYPSHATNFTIGAPFNPGPYPARTLPAETHAFSYDALGRLLTAENADAKVKRTYYPNGLLETDSAWIQTFARDDWTKHAYGLSNYYDRDGRRTRLDIPGQFALGGARSLLAAYEPQLGVVQSLIDLQGGRYDFGYSNRGELASISYPGRYSERYSYDADGRLAGDTIRNDSTTTAPRIQRALVRATTFGYDAQDRVLWSGDTESFADTLKTKYTPLGQLRESQLIQHGRILLYCSAGGCAFPPARWTTVELYEPDALGNRHVGYVLDSTAAGSSYTTKWKNLTSTYEPGSGRQLTDRDVDVSTDYFYDAAGNVDFTSNMSSPAEERVSYFAADGSLRAVESRKATGPNPTPFAFQQLVTEDYRYDALGRRIWVQAQKRCNDVSVSITVATECRISVLRRTIWDGDEELVEVQMPYALQSPGTTVATTPTLWENDTAVVSLAAFGTNAGNADANPHFGQVVYLNGQAIDHPVAITRSRYSTVLDLVNRNARVEVKAPFTIMPFWDSRGDASLGAYSNGAQFLCNPPTSQTACVGIYWAYNFSSFDRQRGVVRDAWHGTLLEGKRDKSGLAYSRNRYYDPASGRFTQEDPIGLAGGINLYGFANGDPVNFSDPFGLNPIAAAAAAARIACSTPIGARACAAGAAKIGEVVARSPGAQRTLQRAKELGDAGEEAVSRVLGIAKNTAVRFGNRIPDFVDEAKGFVAEVKNVQYQAYTRQLREMFTAAAEQGKEIILYVREGGKISGPLSDAIRRFGGRVEPIP